MKSKRRKQPKVPPRDKFQVLFQDYEAEELVVDPAPDNSTIELHPDDQPIELNP